MKMRFPFPLAALCLASIAVADRPKDYARDVTTPAADDYFLVDGATNGTGKTAALLYLRTNGSYANPSWITSLAWSKVTGAPSTLSGYGISDPIALTSGSYANPAWITSLAYAKLTGAPSLGTASTLNVPATGDAASGEVVKGTDSRLTDARTPTTHSHTASQISDSTAAGRTLLTAADIAAQKTALSLSAVATSGAYADLSGKPTFDTLSPMTTLGDVTYGGASGAGTRLAGNTTTARKFLRQVGNGTISAAPAWDTLTSADVGLSAVENTALSTWAGSTAITTLGTIASGTWNGTAISVAKGGTGVATFGGTNRILYTSATDTLTALTAVNSSVLTSSGAGAPQWSTTLPAANMPAHTGEVTSSAGAVALTIDKTLSPTWTGTHTFSTKSFFGGAGTSSLSDTTVPWYFKRTGTSGASGITLGSHLEYISSTFTNANIGVGFLSDVINNGTASGGAGHLVGAIGRVQDTTSGAMTQYGIEGKYIRQGTTDGGAAVFGIADYYGATFGNARELNVYTGFCEVATDSTLTTGVNTGVTTVYRAIKPPIGGNSALAYALRGDVTLKILTGGSITSADPVTAAQSVSISHDGTDGHLASTSGTFRVNVGSGNYMTVEDGAGFAHLGGGTLGHPSFRWGLLYGTTADFNGLVSNSGGAKRVSTQFDKTSNTTLGDVTGLSVALAASTSYRFHAVLFTTSGSSGGVKAAIAHSGTVTNIIYEGAASNSGTITQSRATTSGTAVAAVTAVTAAKITIDGTITTNTSGNLTVQFAQNASNGTASSVLVGSYLEVIGF